MALPRVLREMLSLPTAAFVETAVLDYVRQRCADLGGVSVKPDKYGNLMARYRRQPRRVTPLVFTAHTDHPGFVARRMKDAELLLAEFRGWVEPRYFVGTRVRFWSDGAWAKGRVVKITKPGKMNKLTGRTAPPEEVAIKLKRPIERNSPGMWDLTEPVLRGQRVYARGCDDIAGAASMLALLERLSKKKAGAEVYCLFTRAEEVGFVGAIGAAKAGTIPRRLPVIAIETSKALPSAPQGAGPILRVGDKTSVFPPEVTAFCERVGSELARRRKNFKYQRKLMDGGTCESTAFVAYGYKATGMCVALGNYHNMDEKRRKIAAEYIHLNDWKLMVDWFEAMVLDRQGFGSEGTELLDRLDKRFAAYEKLLI